MNGIFTYYCYRIFTYSKQLLEEPNIAGLD